MTFHTIIRITEVQKLQTKFGWCARTNARQRCVCVVGPLVFEIALGACVVVLLRQRICCCSGADGGFYGTGVERNVQMPLWSGSTA